MCLSALFIVEKIDCANILGGDSQKFLWLSYRQYYESSTLRAKQILNEMIFFSVKTSHYSESDCEKFVSGAVNICNE